MATFDAKGGSSEERREGTRRAINDLGLAGELAGREGRVQGISLEKRRPLEEFYALTSCSTATRASRPLRRKTTLSCFSSTSTSTTSPAANSPCRILIDSGLSTNF